VRRLLLFAPLSSTPGRRLRRPEPGRARPGGDRGVELTPAGEVIRAR